jgi:competence protein ComGE
MLRRSEGYFLAELFLSFSTWLLVTGFLLPLVFLVWEQALLQSLENTATHILYDELEWQVAEGTTLRNRTIHLNGTVYEVQWNDDMSQSEVCVKYTDVNSNLQKKCQRPEQ